MSEALMAADTSWVIALNDDTEVAAGWLSELRAVMLDRPEAWALSSRLVFYDAPDVVHSDGICVDTAGRPADLHGGQPVSELASQPFPIFGASAGAAAYRREVFAELGGFPADFFAYYEDVDLAWRARRRDLVSLCVPSAVVRHHVAATSGPRSGLKARLGARNYLWLIARNMTREDLSTARWQIVGYELAYVLASGRRIFAATAGAAQGVAGWRTHRSAAASFRVGDGVLGLEAHRGLRLAFLARYRRLRTRRGRG
jgi:GT2 family glycosyltransferase